MTTTRYDRMRAAWSNFLDFRPSSSPIPQSRSTSLDLEACDLRADHIRDEQAAEIASKDAEIERLRRENAENALNGAAITECRILIKQIMGGNLAFIDDDVARCIITLRDECERLRQDCAEAYQVVGAATFDGSPNYTDDDVNRALDNLSAASNGEPRPHDDLLPWPKRDNTRDAGPTPLETLEVGRDGQASISPAALRNSAKFQADLDKVSVIRDAGPTELRGRITRRTE